jgi:ElaB/YqjD/DUF883 family membrane-anchored ribosome-binding protein
VPPWKKRTRLAKLSEKLEDVQTALDEANTARGNLSAELRDTPASLEEADETCESLLDELEYVRKAEDEANTVRGRLSAKLRKSRKALTKANEERESLRRKISEESREALEATQKLVFRFPSKPISPEILGTDGVGLGRTRKTEDGEL